MKKLKIFMTGGAGYIGSHIGVALLNAGYEILIYDNFSNSSIDVLRRMEIITGKKISYINGDIRDEAKLEQAIQGYDAVIHLAGLKAVGESVIKPLEYYDNNVLGTLFLLHAMKKAGVNKLIFSSSATVYGNPKFLPLTEEHPLCTTNPYGHTKLVIEEMIQSLYVSDPLWSIAILRYFNPIGAHESGLIGEDPQDIPNNLLPYIAQVALGSREKIHVFGNDYDTHDGTGVRDYIHVVDLARGHLKALEFLDKPCREIINLGTGKGYSVLEVIDTFSKVCGQKLPYEITSRRAGDIASCYADSQKAKKLLAWEAQYNLEKMCEDAWRFQSNNVQRASK